MSGSDRRRRDEERAREDEIDRALHRSSTGPATLPHGRNGPTSPDEPQPSSISDLEAELETLHALYRQFFTGVERRPPLEKRASFEARMTRTQFALTHTSSGSALRFRWVQLSQRAQTYRDLWERELKKRERS